MCLFKFNYYIAQSKFKISHANLQKTTNKARQGNTLVGHCPMRSCRKNESIYGKYDKFYVAQMPKNQHRTINTKRGNTCRDVRICQKGVANRFITYSVSDHPKEIAQRHALLKQRRINVDATSWRCIDVGATLYKRWCACWAAFHASKTFVGKSKWSCAKCTSNWGYAPRLFPDRHTLYVL